MKLLLLLLLNEGGSDLRSEASRLLQTKYSNISYMEYLNKNDLQGHVQSTFYCSSEVACLDVSRRSDYMVCECRDQTLQLWSLHTGNLLWKRPVINKKLYDAVSENALKASQGPCGLLLSAFNSVIFHPSKNVILPGVLSHAYSFNGELTRLFPESHCCFSICALSGDTILTDCPSDAKCVIVWSLMNGREMSRTVRDEDVLTFALCREGKLLAVSHPTGAICLLDVTNGFRTLTEVEGSKACGMMRFSPDRQHLYCWQFQGSYFSLDQICIRCPVNNENKDEVSLDVTYVKCVFQDPCSFLLSDSALASLATKSPANFDIPRYMYHPRFLFVLNKQSVLESYPSSDVIKMLSLEKIAVKDYFTRSLPASHVWNIAFSMTGETIYVVTEEQGRRITLWDSSSGELKAEKKNAGAIHLVALRRGVIFTLNCGTRI